MKYFTPDYLPWGEEYIIHIDEEIYKKFHHTLSSFNVLYARILGLSYPDMLRYFRDHYNAKIVGKMGYYCVMHFDNEKDCWAACNLLSSRWEQILRRL